ncbi:murein biosynthesis integral membrane protein MurJ [Polyangium fumosum]|uniref:Probable lipid II flippase MurJ n=1 Tax=Polyangium fumosum TaxID=889272 RepID=A0A4U1JC69_9BACT|nr:murein biosynthesis integral membrane protein MurJ [Polyangium fumosum]TKD07876.1 murein biosynthesis integral membrane protein MurJ [Polyangium fumosum]
MQSVETAATGTKAPEGAPPRAGGARSAALVTAGIVLSRLVGLVRQRVMAHYFGTSAWADMIAAAFRVGNITQNLMGEGTLSATFIPLYARLRGEGKSEEAARFARSALGLLLVVVVAASALGVLFAPWLSWLVAAGFDEEKLAGTATIVRIVFPMTGLLVLSAWGLGVLNAHRRFFLPYAAPVVWSLAQIAALVVAGTFLGQRGGALATALAWGAFAGAFLQVVVLLPAATRALRGLGGAAPLAGAKPPNVDHSIAPRFDAKDPHVREAAARLPGALVGRGIIQISGLVDTLLVSFLGTGANATFGYAQTIYLLPMSVLGTGEAAAALPELSRDTAEADVAKRNAAVRARLGASLARIAVLTVPATLVFVLLGGDLVALLLQTGTFDQAATARVKPLLAAYGFALLGNAAGRVLTTTAYALGDTRTPARFAVLRVVVSTALALVLMRPLGVLGVVLGAVIAGWVETCAMGIRLSQAIGGLGLEAIRGGRIALLGGLSVGAGVLVRSVLPASLEGTAIGAMLSLGTFGAAFVVLCPLLGLFDVRSLLRRARR